METFYGFWLKTYFFVRYCVDMIIDKIFGIYYNSKKRSVPKITNPIVLESATSLAKKIRSRKLSSETIVQAFIDRIMETNPIINAMVDNRFEEALKEAREIDEGIKSGKVGSADFDSKPFLGVPFTNKESHASKGMSFTFGLKKRIGIKADFDASCVQMIKKAGAILLGVTNVPQINFWIESSNPVYGQTRNPHDTTRNVGGSCGGEGCILAACGSPLGLGSDGGGSARLPALMNGVYAHKVTNNLISMKGLTYRKDDERDTMLTSGPMTRYAEDLAPFVKALIGKGADILKLDDKISIKKIKVYYITDPKDTLMSPISDEMHDVLIHAVSHFKNICEEEPEELTFKDLRYQYKLFRYFRSIESTNFRNDINNREGEVNTFREILKHFTIGGDFTTATILNLMSGWFKLPDADWVISTTDGLRKSLLEKLDNNSILLYPSAPFPASYHHTALLRPYNFGFFAIWSVLKFPATQVPMGLGEEGLPLGLQVVAAPYQDRLCLAAAKELERFFKGFVPAGGVGFNK